MKRKLLAGVCVVMFGVSGMAYSDDTTVTLDGNTSGSGFSIKDSSGTSIARFQGDGKVGIGTTGPTSRLHIGGSPSVETAIEFGSNPGIYLYDDNNLRVANLNSGTGGFLIEGNVGIGTTNPGAKLDVNGGIKSSMWKVTKAIPYAGSAYPRNGSFTSSGGTLMIYASGSAYNSSGHVLQVDVDVDGTVCGSLNALTNEFDSHKTLVSDVIIVSGLSAGSHSVNLTLVYGNSDSNDYSQVTIMELPF